ncbi:MAG: GNAT family N-acetyltransferase [candidate division WOR-3 bacterium]
MSTHRIVIRRAVPADFDAICELAEQMDRRFRKHLPDRFRKPRGRVRHRDRTEELMHDPNTLLAVAEQDHRVVGIVNAGLKEMPDYPQKRPLRSVVIRGIVVRSTHRRRGIGTRLLAEVKRWALGLDADELQASVYDFDSAARAFFVQAGMTLLSHRLALPLKPSRPRFIRRT